MGKPNKLGQGKGWPVTLPTPHTEPSQPALLLVEGDWAGLLIFAERVKFWISETFLGFQKVGMIVKKKYKGLGHSRF